MGALVKVFVYNLANSSSTNTKSSCSGINIPLALHTSIVVFNKEYTFTFDNGITINKLKYEEDPEVKEKYFDCTRRTEKELDEFINEVTPEWQKKDYDVLQKNCHNFCIMLCEFLEISCFPKYVRELPEVGKKIFGTQHNLIKFADIGICGTIALTFGGIVSALFKSS